MMRVSKMERIQRLAAAVAELLDSTRVRVAHVVTEAHQPEE